jgi:pimeloyl-ACP methyl ester carboxylesterase
MSEVVEHPALVSERLRVGPFDLEMLHSGTKRAGAPTFVLVHGVNNISPHAPFLERLAAHGEVFAPSHPGFGQSPDPADCDTMYDLAQVYRGVLDAIPAEKAILIGFSFGGWIAAEVAVAGHPKLAALILVDPLGIKLAGREERDFPHLFNTSPHELTQRAWHDAANRPAGCYGVGWHAAIGDAMSDEEMTTLARNWDSLCLYAWRPHMYNPQLKHWLHRISVPTLVLWGASDRIVTPAYGRAYAGLIPGAEFSVIEAAGHHPELERPDAFVERVGRFVDRRKEAR